MATKKKPPEAPKKEAAAPRAPLSAAEKRFEAEKRARAEKTLAKIERMAKGTLGEVKKGENPVLSIPIRALSNVSFNEKKRVIELGDKAQSREFFNKAMAKKFMQTFLVAGAVKELLDASKTTSIRDLFYMTKHTIAGSRENTFDEQSESDPVIEDLEVAVDALREELHLFANPKGKLVGPMTIEDSGDEIDLSRMGSGGYGIPSIVEDARTGLLVEKENVEQLATAIKTLIKDRAKAQRLGEAAQEFIRANFSSTQMARQTMAVYKSVLSRKT